MRRRSLLYSLVVTPLLSGCTAPSGPSSEDDCTNCTTSAGSPQTPSKQTTECTVPDSSPLPSAELPSELPRDSAESLALSVEETYAVQRAENDGWTVDGTDGVYATVEQSDTGFLVKATVNLDTTKYQEESTGTSQTLYGSLTYSGWYRVTDQKAERAPGEGHESPPEWGWMTIVCS